MVEKLQRRVGLLTGDAAAEAGVSSPVGFRWFRHAGGVNPCLAVGAMLATHAATALIADDVRLQFQSALASRDIIGQAKGMIMDRFDVGAVRAFELLTQTLAELQHPARRSGRGDCFARAGTENDIQQTSRGSFHVGARTPRASAAPARQMSLQSAVLALTKPVPLHVQLHQHHPCVPAARRIASGLDNPCSGANSASITSHIWQQKVRLSDALGGRWAPPATWSTT